MKQLTLQQRLDNNSQSITETGCQIWLSPLNEKGYGQISVNGKPEMAHRASWSLANNKKIPRGKMILHSCDIPCCINPNHLRIGTPSNNWWDALKRNRLTLGQITTAMDRTYNKKTFELLEKAYSRKRLIK